MVKRTFGVGANRAWSSSQDPNIGSWPQSEPQWPKLSTASNWEWWRHEGSFNAKASTTCSQCCAREEDAGSRCDPMRPRKCRGCRQRCVLSERETWRRGRALELALSKAQKQAEDLPVARQIEVTKEFIAGAKKRMLVADEKIRLVQVALQDAMEENEYDIREVPLAEARLELQKEIVPPRQTPPISTVPNLEAEVQRLRILLAQMEVSQSNLVTHQKVQVRQQTC